MTGAPVYLRDLSETEKESFLRSWKRNNQNDLLKAYKEGIDITVGYYLDNDSGVIE